MDAWPNSVHSTQARERLSGDRPLLTVNDVARRLQVSVRTVRRWTASGELPTVKAGGSVRVTPEALEMFIGDRDKLAGLQKLARREQLRKAMYPTRDPIIKVRFKRAEPTTPKEHAA
jgi:excisionase family DNA binding protein